MDKTTIQIQRQERLREIFDGMIKPGHGEDFLGSTDYWRVRIVSKSIIPGLPDLASVYFYGVRKDAEDFGTLYPHYDARVWRVQVDRASRAEILAQLVARQQEMEAMRLVLEMGE